MARLHDRDRVERLAMADRAAGIGREYELGGLRASYRQGRAVARAAWGCLLLLAAVAAVLAAIPVGLGTAGWAGAGAAVGTGAVLAVAGVALSRTAPPQQVEWVFVYEGGVAADGALVPLGRDQPDQYGGEPGAPAAARAAPRVIRWGDLDRVSHEFAYGEDRAPALRAIHLAGTDGTEITARSGYRDLDELGEELDAVRCAARLPAALGQWEDGAPVRFGALTVSRDGIDWSGTAWGGAVRAAWPDVVRVTLRRAEIALDVRAAGRAEHRVIYLTGVPDSRVALLLVQQAAGRLGIEQWGDPVRLPAGVTAGPEPGDPGGWQPVRGLP